MKHHQPPVQRRLVLLVVLALTLAVLLAACGQTRSTATDGGTEASTADTHATTPSHSTGSSSSGGPGIDQSKIDVCARMPRAQIETIIGPLVEAPKPIIAVGSEVGCDYLVAEGRGYNVTIYNLDRWELIPQFIDVTPVPDLGDGAYLQHRSVDGSNQLYVLLHDRAIVSVGVNGADTPQLRQLLDLALAETRRYP